MNRFVPLVPMLAFALPAGWTVAGTAHSLAAGIAVALVVAVLVYRNRWLTERLRRMTAERRVDAYFDDAAHLSVLQVDRDAAHPESRITRASAEFCEMVGYTAAELATRPWRSFLYDAAALEHAEGIAAVASTTGNADGVTVWRHGRTRQPIYIEWLTMGCADLWKAKNVTEVTRLRGRAAAAELLALTAARAAQAGAALTQRGHG